MPLAIRKKAGTQSRIAGRTNNIEIINIKEENKSTKLKTSPLNTNNPLTNNKPPENNKN